MSRSVPLPYVIALVVALVGAWWFWDYGPEINLNIGGNSTPGATQTVEQKTPVLVTHLVNGKMHLYSGLLLVPACTGMKAGLNIFGENPTHVNILVTFEKDKGQCIYPQVHTTEFRSAVESTSTPVVDGLYINGVLTESKVVESGKK